MPYYHRFHAATQRNQRLPWERVPALLGYRPAIRHGHGNLCQAVPCTGASPALEQAVQALAREDDLLAFFDRTLRTQDEADLLSAPR